MLVIYSLFFIVLPRIHDVGMRWWWLLICFIPGANIVLGIILMLRGPEYHFGASVGAVEQKSE
jgi:uncharacterized membrane protein YhaH (DUF805 family)